ncbi:MAG: adenylate kinase [Clostridia bacterium]|nr:adenylate kinase [Clostridia bacterium]
MRIILLGPPAAGKGTQAENLSEKFKIPTISTGEMIRSEIAAGTQLGERAAKIINGGNLLPDDVIIDMIKSRIAQEDCKNGFILDGFPRTPGQAEASEQMGIKIDKVISIFAPDEEIVKRISGRRICENCKTGYHTMYNKPEKEGVCDKCGGKLICRDDDTEETVKVRLNVYHKKTEPLIQYYANKGLLVEVESQEKIEDTTALMFKRLGV